MFKEGVQLVHELKSLSDTFLDEPVVAAGSLQLREALACAFSVVLKQNPFISA